MLSSEEPLIGRTVDTRRIVDTIEEDIRNGVEIVGVDTAGTIERKGLLVRMSRFWMGDGAETGNQATGAIKKAGRWIENIGFSQGYKDKIPMFGSGLQVDTRRDIGVVPSDIGM